MSRTAGRRVRRVLDQETSSAGVPALGYRPALDGLRAIAVLGVMSWHFVLPGVKGGFLGVDLFFVLSGFLITKLLAEEWELDGSIHLGRFYLRRMLRLFPALFVVLLVTLPLVPRIWTIQALLYVSNWGLLTGHLGPSAIMQMWSLSVEEQFYLVWPPLLLLLLVLRTPRRAIVATVALLAAASATFKIVAWHSIDDWSRFYFGSDGRADELLVGAGLALLVSWSTFVRKPRVRQFVQVATVLAVVWLGYLFVASAVYWKFFYRQGGITLVAIATAIVILNLLLVPQGWLATGLSARPLVAIGRMSYGLYLWHSPVGGLTDARHVDWMPELPRAVLFVVRVALTFGVAALSYRYLERPILALKHRFAAVRSPRPG